MPVKRITKAQAKAALTAVTKGASDNTSNEGLIIDGKKVDRATEAAERAVEIDLHDDVAIDPKKKKLIE